jgi:hypothetical protein
VPAFVIDVGEATLTDLDDGWRACAGRAAIAATARDALRIRRPVRHEH